MKGKIYAFRLIIALITFTLGISIFSIWQYAQPLFHSQPAAVPSKLPEIQPMEPLFLLQKVEVYKPKPAEPEFDAGGDYYIVGKLPKGFEDFDQLSISAGEYKPNENGVYELIPTPPEGALFTKKTYKLSQININNKQISFTTEEIKGISYEFVGKFLDEKNFQTIKGETVVLKGQLIKRQNGKKIAESKVNFGYLECC